MTALTARPLSDSTDSLLRFAMRADATLCAGVGLLVAMTADPLSRLSGLSPTAEWIGGAGFVACGFLLYVLAAAPDIRSIGIGVVSVNLVSSVVAVAAVASGWLPLTEFGAVLTLAVTAVGLGLAWLQYRGVRRI
jgi:hypothetical protein